MKFAIASVLMPLLMGAAAVPSAIEVPWSAVAMQGLYTGELSGEDYSAPVITELFLIDEDELLGSYFVEAPLDSETTELVLGVLSDCELVSSHRLNCLWSDRFGSGTLKLTFTEDYQSFEGQWSPDLENAAYPWGGER